MRDDRKARKPQSNWFIDLSHAYDSVDREKIIEIASRRLKLQSWEIELLRRLMMPQKIKVSE